MSRVIYGPDDGPLNVRYLQGDKCPKCGSKNYTESWWRDDDDQPAGANMDCNDCGHLWGWTT